MKSPAGARVGILIAIAIVALATGIVIRSRGSSGQEPSERVETVATGPAGQPGPVDIISPNYPDDPGEPTIEGPFRLIPFGFFDKSPQPAPTIGTCERPDPVTRETATIEHSPLFVTVAYVPRGFSAPDVRVTQACGTEILELFWRLQGTKAGTIEISRALRRPPLDVRIPPPDSWLTIEMSTINGHAAVLGKSKPGQGGPQSIHMFDGEIYTQIQGDIEDFAELLKLAESLN